MSARRFFSRFRSTGSTGSGRPDGVPDEARASGLPPVPAGRRRARQRYWRFNLLVISVLLMISFAVSFGIPLWARELFPKRFFGWSVPFYVGAQGAILVYLALVLVYILLMQGADRRFRRSVQEAGAGGDRAAAPRTPSAADT
jgi:putative solute:sodium symporter small subunit